MSENGYSLRDYQQSAVRRVIEAWTCRRSVLVQMPTGTGKTRVLAAIVGEELEAGGATEDGGVWIIAHRRELVGQINTTVRQFLAGRRIKVCSVQWLARHLNDISHRPRLIVIDEAHHALADTYRELWRRYPEAKKLGMTATPCRMNRRGFTDLFDTLITSDSIADFIRKGWLSAFDYVSIRSDSDDQRLIDGLEKRGTDGDYQIKEMNAVFNRRPTIERLYESVRQYADGKKGIVYAISISHARNIAAYYKEHGINAVAIDSRTPANERKCLIEDFKQGKIQVLVNVDVFSEGFDCPDVEFIQLARPTLSLAKYLQQVGRGLRKTDGKESCVLIDNVGLYRLFGLPTTDRDWQAMFEGRLAGKGYPATNARTVAYMTATQTEDETVETVGQLETIVSHGQLLGYLQSGASLPESNGNHSEELKSFKDRQSGLWGLRQGQTITATARYLAIFDIRDGLAAVKFKDYRAGIVDANGNVRMKLDRYRKIRLLPDDIISVEDNADKTFYIDLKSGSLYTERPRVLRFGTVEMLKVGDRYCSRTKHVYKSRSRLGDFDIIPRGFYLRIHDKVPCRHEFKSVDGFHSLLYRDCVCIFADDGEDYYWLCGELADGSIVIADGKGNYYHAAAGREKKYIASEHPKNKTEDFDTAVPRLLAEAEARAARMREAARQENEQKQRKRLADIQDAVPFKSGLKWGLKSGGRVIVPPVYRSIQKPVGNYCAVEASPRQWGVIMLDGKVVVEACYSKVVINSDGTARLTVIPGKEKTVDLGT